MSGHFNRIPQKKRSGIVTQPANGQQKRSNDLLVLTSISEIGAAAPAKPATSTGRTVTPRPQTVVKGAPPAQQAAPASDANPLDPAIREAVIVALAEAGDEGLNKSKLSTAVMKAFNGADKAKAVKRVNEVSFLSGNEDAWVFDADSGTLISVG